MSLLVNKVTFLSVFTTCTKHQTKLFLSTYNKTNDGEDIGSELLNTLTKKHTLYTAEKKTSVNVFMCCSTAGLACDQCETS